MRASVLEVAPPDQAIVGAFQRHACQLSAIEPLMIRLCESEIQTLQRFKPTALDPHIVPSSGSLPLCALGMLLRL